METLRQLSAVKHSHCTLLLTSSEYHNFTLRIVGSTVFSKLDLQKGYYQVPVAPEDIQKTAIVTPFRMYAFLHMSLVYVLMPDGSSSRRSIFLFCVFGQHPHLQSRSFLSCGPLPRGLPSLPEAWVDNWATQKPIFGF